MSRTKPEQSPATDQAVLSGSADQTRSKRWRGRSGDEPAASGPKSVSPASSGEQVRTIRHAHLYLTRLDPWSVMKNAFMFAIAVAIIIVVATMILWGLLAASGTLESLSGTVNDVAGAGATSVDLAGMFSFGRVLGTSLVIATMEVILVSALATLFAYLYNLGVAITGGLQVTLTEDN